METGQINWKMKQLAIMNEAEKNFVISNITREADNVNALYLGCLERAIKSLFFLNSGGTVTILTYIYNIKEPSINIFIEISLVIFLLGLILVFNVVVRDFYYVQRKSLEFHGDVRKFLLNNTPFSDIRRFQFSLELVDKQTNLTIKLGEISAYCVVWGVFFGLLGYLL